MSYYGCDQSQMQKNHYVLKIKMRDKKYFFFKWYFQISSCIAVLFLIGVGIGSYSQINADFISSLPKQDGIPSLIWLSLFF